jgi:hypothetical protein
MFVTLLVTLYSRIKLIIYHFANLLPIGDQSKLLIVNIIYYFLLIEKGSQKKPFYDIVDKDKISQFYALALPFIRHVKRFFTIYQTNNIFLLFVLKPIELLGSILFLNSLVDRTIHPYLCRSQHYF